MNMLNERLSSLATPQTGTPYVRRLATLLKALAVVLLASTAAQLTWFFLADPPVPLKSAGVATPVDATKTKAIDGNSLQSTKTSLSDLAKIHLFGTPPATQPRQSTVPTDAPKTRLNLRLTGILAIGGDGQGVAIIARGNDQRVYTTGANLPGNAILKYVHRDRVILSRAGRFEMLPLSRDKLDISQTDAGVQAASPGEFPVNGSAREAETVETEQSHIPRNELTQLREELNNNPQRLADLIQFTPIMSGDGIRGFRIQPRSAGRDYFQRAGLEENDIVTAINGIPVSDMQQMSGLINQLETVRELRLQVERGGREQQLVVGID